MSNDPRLKKLLESKQLGPSSLQEIYQDASGKKWEKLTQKIDRLSGRLEERVRSANKDIVEKVTVNEYQEPQTQKTSATLRDKYLADMPEATRQALIRAKFKKKQEKRESKAEAIRIAQLDEEELMEEAKKSESQRKIEAQVAERNQLAVKNVDEQRDLKAQLAAEGKDPSAIRKALKSLKKSQRVQASEEEEDEPKKKAKRRGRKPKAALKHPAKDPKSGLMVEFESLSE